MPIGSYDPDYDGGGVGHPPWQTPKTELAREALSACGRKYFRGTSKASSDFRIWDRLEDRASGASDESYLFRCWIEHCIKWAKSKNVAKTIIPFCYRLDPYNPGGFLGMLQSAEHSNDWIAKNRLRLLDKRGMEVIKQFEKARELPDG